MGMKPCFTHRGVGETGTEDNEGSGIRGALVTLPGLTGDTIAVMAISLAVEFRSRLAA